MWSATATGYEDAVFDELERELRGLAEADPALTDTTLLILPDALEDFLAYNDFLYLAERPAAKPAAGRYAADRELSSRTTSSKAPSPTISRTTPTARRIRSCICCGKTASSARSRRFRCRRYLRAQPGHHAAAGHRRLAAWMAESGEGEGSDRRGRQPRAASRQVRPERA